MADRGEVAAARASVETAVADGMFSDDAGWASNIVCLLALLRYRDGDLAAALEAAERRLETEPGDELMAGIVARSALIMGLEERDPDRPPVSDRADDRPDARNGRILSLMDATPPDAALRRPARDAAPSGEVTLVRGDRPSGTVIVFSGLAGRTAVPVPVLDRFMAALGLSVVYLRDAGRWLHLRGAEELGGWYQETVQALRGVVEQAGGGPVTTIGMSSGGYPALRYGLDLGADATLCFSPPTNLTPAFLAGDRRGRLVARRLQTNLPPEMLEVRPALAVRDRVHPVELVYGADMPEDRMHAEHLRGVPGVTLHPLEGLAEHESLHALIRGGGALAFFERHIPRRLENEA